MNGFYFIILLSIGFTKPVFSGPALEILNFGVSKYSDTIIIKNTGRSINTAFQEYAPVISADGSVLIFTSRRPVDANEVKEGRPSLEHVYMSSGKSSDSSWNAPFLLGKTINQPDRHNSAIGLSNDGQRMLLYRDDSYGNGDIFESYLSGNEWTDPRSMGKPICSKAHESSASISPDGRKLYFVSNRNGGIGGRDIWISKQDNNGKWGDAVNAGSVINTPAEEEGVYIHPDGKTLYFSSNKPGGFGGFDIYKTVLEKGTWTVPVNMGRPLNSEGDDLYFVLDASGKTGYYSSSKPGGFGQQDIYVIHFIQSEKSEKLVGPRLHLLKGIVKDSISGMPVEASIEIINNQKNELISTISSNSASGKYLISLPAGINYGLRVQATGYLFYSANVDIPDTASYSEVIKNISLMKLEVGNKIILKNIFYDFNKADLRIESQAELNHLVNLLKEMPALKIEISSHTDNKGSDDYNRILSEKRAESVVNYLVNAGIDKNRLVAKGYGETIPLVGNDTPEGQQTNRRTEFVILAK